MNKKKKEGEGMKKENVHAKHKKSLAERFWKQKYLFLRCFHRWYGSF